MSFNHKISSICQPLIIITYKENTVKCTSINVKTTVTLPYKNLFLDFAFQNAMPVVDYGRIIKIRSF